ATVQSAMLSFDTLEKRPYLSMIAHVARKANCSSSPETPERTDGLLNIFRLASTDANAHSRARQRLSDSATDALCTTRYDRHLAVEIHKNGFLFISHFPFSICHPLQRRVNRK